VDEGRRGLVGKVWKNFWGKKHRPSGSTMGAEKEYKRNEKEDFEVDPLVNVRRVWAGPKVIQFERKKKKTTVKKHKAREKKTSNKEIAP